MSRKPTNAKSIDRCPACGLPDSVRQDVRQPEPSRDNEVIGHFMSRMADGDWVVIYGRDGLWQMLASIDEPLVRKVLQAVIAQSDGPQ